jgi:hypothetical protein
MNIESEGTWETVLVIYLEFHLQIERKHSPNLESEVGPTLL